jgi:alpha-glucosidase
LTGPADYTFCWYSNKLKVTRAHQLALSTLYFSPWQVLFWYDRPAQYDGDPGLGYWKHLPTCWDETRVLHGDVGKYVTIARRKGREWFVGTIRPDGGDVETPLSFLDPGQIYTATVYGDDAGSKRVKITTREVNRETVLTTTISPNGGQAIWIAPHGRPRRVD